MNVSGFVTTAWIAALATSTFPLVLRFHKIFFNLSSNMKPFDVLMSRAQLRKYYYSRFIQECRYLPKHLLYYLPDIKNLLYIWNLIETQTSIVYQKILCQSKIFSIALEII